jgi:hypothetical protein
MALDQIVDEVKHLHRVGTRLEEYAEKHPRISKGLLGVATSVRNAATLLDVLLATTADDEKPSKIQ